VNDLSSQISFLATDFRDLQTVAMQAHLSDVTLFREMTLIPE
jgi:hypothetical protein